MIESISALGLYQIGVGSLLTKADILTTMGFMDQAFIELGRFQDLKDRTYEQNETRNHAWKNIVMAKALLRLKEYPEATHKISNALFLCYTIHSRQNMIIIADFYRQLATSPYGPTREVQALGERIQQCSRELGVNYQHG